MLAGPTTEDLATYASAGRMPEGGYLASLDTGSLEGARFGLVGTGWRDDFLPLDPVTAEDGHVYARVGERRRRRARHHCKRPGRKLVSSPDETRGHAPRRRRNAL